MSCAVQQYQGAEKPTDGSQTRRAYKIEVEEFIAFAGLRGIAELRGITRAPVIGWRNDFEKRAIAPPASAASSRRSRPCSTISVSITPWSATS